MVVVESFKNSVHPSSVLWFIIISYFLKQGQSGVTAVSVCVCVGGVGMVGENTCCAIVICKHSQVLRELCM